MSKICLIRKFTKKDNNIYMSMYIIFDYIEYTQCNVFDNSQHL